MADKDFVIENGVLIKYCGNGGHIVIPDNVHVVGEESFSGSHANWIKSVMFSNNVMSIENGAFCGCMYLERAILSKSIVSIKDYAFAYCVRLSIFIPKSVTEIGYRAFDLCKNLTIYAPRSSYAERYAKENNIRFVESEDGDVIAPEKDETEVVAAEENVTETKSIVEQKKEALINAVIKAWDDPFCDWELEESEDNPNVLVLGTKTPKTGFVFFMAGCRDLYGGIIWVEYEPEEDLVGIYIKDRAVQPQFKEDIVNLFEKYAPFNMKVSFEGESTPIISRKEKVEPQDFVNFFEDFRAAYDKYYPLFYMVTVSAIKWYDGFYIAGADC